MKMRGSVLNGLTNGVWFGAKGSISSEGTIVAAAAPFADGPGINSGSVQVFRYNTLDNDWERLGQTLNGEAEDDRLARFMCLSGDGMVVAAGTPDNDSNRARSGHVRVWRYDEATSTRRCRWGWFWRVGGPCRGWVDGGGRR